MNDAKLIIQFVGGVSMDIPCTTPEAIETIARWRNGNLEWFGFNNNLAINKSNVLSIRWVPNE